MSPTTSPALPGSDTVLPSPECADTLAHLVLCHAPANGVRVTAELTFAADGAPRARIALQLGAQPALVGLETALRLLDLLRAEPPHGDGRLHRVESDLHRAIRDAGGMAFLARRDRARPERRA